VTRRGRRGKGVEWGFEHRRDRERRTGIWRDFGVRSDAVPHKPQPPIAALPPSAAMFLNAIRTRQHHATRRTKPRRPLAPARPRARPCSVRWTRAWSAQRPSPSTSVTTKRRLIRLSLSSTPFVLHARPSAPVAGHDGSELARRGARAPWPSRRRRRAARAPGARTRRVRPGRSRGRSGGAG
jgi:hypothetical protein